MDTNKLHRLLMMTIETKLQLDRLLVLDKELEMKAFIEEITLSRNGLENWSYEIKRLRDQSLKS